MQPPVRADVRDDLFRATALAAAIGDTTAVPPEIAKAQAIALAGVFQIISEAGRCTRESQSQVKIADDLDAIVENVLDELDRWLSVRMRRRGD